MSWGAVDRSRSDGHSDELVGFVTARIVMAKESEVGLFVLKGLDNELRTSFYALDLSYEFPI